MTVTLTKRNTEKSGNVAYALAGVRASAYFNKSMFAKGAEAPAGFKLVPIDADGNELEASPFVTPAEAKVKKAKLTPEEFKAKMAAARAARKNETPEQKSARIREKAAKLIEKANKLVSA